MVSALNGIFAATSEAATITAQAFGNGVSQSFDSETLPGQSVAAAYSASPLASSASVTFGSTIQLKASASALGAGSASGFSTFISDFVILSNGVPTSAWVLLTFSINASVHGVGADPQTGTGAVGLTITTPLETASGTYSDAGTSSEVLMRDFHTITKTGLFNSNGAGFWVFVPQSSASISIQLSAIALGRTLANGSGSLTVNLSSAVVPSSQGLVSPALLFGNGYTLNASVANIAPEPGSLFLGALGFAALGFGKLARDRARRTSKPCSSST
jgi:hypothetical protein